MLRVSERRACRVIGQPRSTQRRLPQTPDDEVMLTADIVELATRYGRYGYRRITALLRHGAPSGACGERVSIFTS
jgi:putative transposase